MMAAILCLLAALLLAALLGLVLVGLAAVHAADINEHLAALRRAETERSKRWN